MAEQQTKPRWRHADQPTIVEGWLCPREDDAEAVAAYRRRLNEEQNRMAMAEAADALANLQEKK